MAPSDVDYALQTLVSKIKERELESQRALSEHDVANRLLKLQLQELQKKLNEKESQLADANETIRALRSVTQIITGLQDEIRALRTQLRTSHAHKHRLVTTPKKNPATRSTSNTTQASDNLSCHTLHPTETGPTCSDYISQNSSQECTLLKLISDCGRTTDVAVPGVKQEEQEVLMDEGEGGGHEDRETEGQVPDESLKVENSEWDGGFENSHAEEAQTVHSAKQTVEILKGKILNLEGKVESLTEERNFLREGLEGALKLKAEVGEPSQQPSNQTISDISSDSAETSEFEPLPKKKKKDRRETAVVQNAAQSRKRLLLETPLNSHSGSVTLIDTVSDKSEEESDESVVLPPSKRATLNDDIVTAFKEWPSFVKTLKDLVTAMKIPSASPVLPLDISFSEPPVSTPTREMVQLPGGLSIPKRMYDRLSRSKMSLFAQELAVVIFGRDTLAKCSLTGRKTNKSPLDPAKVNAIIDAVIGHFPGTSPSEIRAVLRRKCNNESFALKGQSVDMEVRPGRSFFN
ncbi:uncharacterized protein si:dkey-92i17.2 isoform X1 [Alosa alosa]|uniref:uncharacterized protein si:dkey-92i17.2 isoform X1 n=1 Tax=Alosa alosa TaxID=278164 RepID=UPI0020151F3C|nr:uncharacterized protein si:dkey-92i17.2 isoform X1 [Alosa alosa]